MSESFSTVAGGRTAGQDKPPVESVLLDVDQVAGLLRCSSRHVYRLTDGGRMPRPVKLGALVRWRAAEIREWIASGCPSVRNFRGGKS